MFSLSLSFSICCTISLYPTLVYTYTHIHTHIHILLHASNIGWCTNERSLFIKWLISTYHHKVCNFFAFDFFITNYEITIKLWEAKNCFFFYTIQWNNFSIFFYKEVIIFRKCIIQNGDMLWYAFTSGIFPSNIFLTRFACSSIIRVVSIASSLQLFAPMYVYNDRGMRYAGKKRISIKRQELLHSHVSFISNIYDGYSDEIF